MYIFAFKRNLNLGISRKFEVCALIYSFIQSGGNVAHSSLKIRTFGPGIIKNMKATSDKSHPPANNGDNVTIPIPDVDKGRGDPRNINGVILQRNDEGFYKVAPNMVYYRNYIAEIFLSVCDVDQDTEISLRTAATKHSLGSGQGFVRCRCERNCLSNRYECKKKMVLCNTKCHQRTPCKNK